MRPLKLSSLLLLTLLSVGCDALGFDEPVRVRVQNGTDRVFDEGVLYVRMDSILFPGLQPGSFTPYREVERAYEIATVQVVSEADTARIQVIDFVGEKPLEGGRYTYLLTYFEGNPRSLDLRLLKDR